MASPIRGHIYSLLDEILLHIMTFLDGKSIGCLGLSTKRFFLLNLNEDLWRIKLAIDYQMTSYEETSFRDSYKWSITVTSISDRLWKKLMNCQYDFPEEFQPYLLEALRIPGPRVLTQFEMAWSILMECPYDLPQEVQPIIYEALQNSVNKKNTKRLAIAEHELDAANRELEEAERNLQEALARVDLALMRVEQLKSKVNELKKN